jgi:hypothetical protein
MSELSAFFTEHDASLGQVFYPRDFLVATLPSAQAAFAAAIAVEKTVPKEDRQAVSAGEMLEFFNEFHSRTGVSGGAMRALSRFVDTEAKWADADIKSAKRGYGFLVVRSDTKETALSVASRLAPFQPISIEWYRALGVESL